MRKKSKTKRPGKVQKIIKHPDPKEPEKAEIVVDGAEELYREIRIENALENDQGEQVKLKPGAQVEIVVEAEEKDTVPKNQQT